MTRRRRLRLITVTTPRGTAWTIPRARALAVTEITEHLQYLSALAQEKPSIYRALLNTARRLAARHTKQFRKTIARYEGKKSSS